MERETPALVSPPVIREEANRWCGERIEPGAEAARRDDLARDVARLWRRHVLMQTCGVPDEGELTDALDRLADAHGQQP